MFRIRSFFVGPDVFGFGYRRRSLDGLLRTAVSVGTFDGNADNAVLCLAQYLERLRVVAARTPRIRS